ncbi:MAG: histidine phosphatase family protein [Pirellulaceae bacterium]
MIRFVLIRPGSTDFDDQGRIKGTLDMPLNGNGTTQVAQAVTELNGMSLDCIYASPCQSAQQTASALAAGREVKVKVLDKLGNMDHGLWHGKLIEEVKQKQPKVYRQGLDNPESLCPPGGEALSSVKDRVAAQLEKLIKKHRQGVVALVAPEPLASIVRCVLEHSDLIDLWKSERDAGNWELIDVEPGKLVAS